MRRTGDVERVTKRMNPTTVTTLLSQRTFRF